MATDKGIKLPPFLVAHFKETMIAKYGPRALRLLLQTYDRKEITAEEVIEGLRAALDVMDGAQTILTGEKVQP